MHLLLYSICKMQNVDQLSHISKAVLGFLVYFQPINKSI